jgi:hypothetical protein
VDFKAPPLGGWGVKNWDKKTDLIRQK